MANSEIILRPANLADVAEIARVHYAALQPYHEFYGAFLATHPRVLLPKLTVKAMGASGCLFLVAERRDALGLVGFLRYEVKDARAYVTDEKPALIDAKSDEITEPLLSPKGHLKDLWEKFQDTESHMDDCYEKQSSGRRHICTLYLPSSTALPLLNVCRCEAFDGPSVIPAARNRENVTSEGC